MYNSIKSKKVIHIPSLKNTLLLKNANHHLSLQQVTIFFAIVTSKIIDHRSPSLTYNNNEKVGNIVRSTKV